MSEQIVVLNGIFYDYIDEIKFYKMVGLLNSETKMFEGIEVITDKIESLESMKKRICALNSNSISVTTGYLSEKIEYYKFNTQLVVVSKAELKSLDGVSFAGHEWNEELFTENTNSRFQTVSSVDFIVDEELKTILDRIVISQQKNPVFSKLHESIQQKIVTPKEKILNN